MIHLKLHWFVPFIAIVILGLGAGAGLSSVRAVTELQPNIEALPARELRLETDAGRTYLRFSTTTWNSGQGPLELVAGSVDPSQGRQNVYQRIHSDDGSYRNVYVGAFVWHSDHNHFHFEDYATYTLQPVSAPGASSRSSSKTTFCIMDTDRIDHRLPGAPKRAVYTSCSNAVQGMSVGWGDTYRYYLAGQEIEVTDLPSGDYRLTVEADPKGRLVEISKSDNTSEILIRLNVEEGTVVVLDGNSAGNGRGNGPRR